jgi:hypothetical protein
MPDTATTTRESDHEGEVSAREFPMPFQYDLVAVGSVENLGLPIGSMKGALQPAIGTGRPKSTAGLISYEMFSASSTGKSSLRFARSDWNRVKHRIKEDLCEAAIAEAVEVRPGFDHVGGI